MYIYIQIDIDIDVDIDIDIDMCSCTDDANTCWNKHESFEQSLQSERRPSGCSAFKEWMNRMTWTACNQKQSQYALHTCQTLVWVWKGCTGQECTRKNNEGKNLEKQRSTGNNGRATQKKNQRKRNHRIARPRNRGIRIRARQNRKLEKSWNRHGRCQEIKSWSYVRDAWRTLLKTELKEMKSKVFKSKQSRNVSAWQATMALFEFQRCCSSTRSSCCARLLESRSEYRNSWFCWALPKVFPQPASRMGTLRASCAPFCKCFGQIY